MSQYHSSTFADREGKFIMKCLIVAIECPCTCVSILRILPARLSLLLSVENPRKCAEPRRQILRANLVKTEKVPSSSSW